MAGQAAALLIVRAGLGYELPMGWAMAAVAASCIVNIAASLPRGSTWLDDTKAALFLGYDLLQLAVLLYLTGGLHNPFAILILAPVTVSATVLSRRSTTGLALLAVAAVAVLALMHLPLPWADRAFRLQPLFIAGLWLGTGAVALAGLAGAVVLLAASDLLGAAVFSGLNAVPVVILVRQALLARKAKAVPRRRRTCPAGER